jgi:2-amino-4-hydroxy-6-hydroxymethyldihydropteridine diphosphokinase
MIRGAGIRAFVGAGANLGDRAQTIAQAIERLGQTKGVRVVRVSSLLENPAVGGPEDSPAYLNAVIEITTTLGGHELLHRLLDIERELGRLRRQRWEPRTIDLDLLLYGERVISSDELVVPHPLMHERRFVLAPLAEIAPDVVHPTLQMSARGLLDALDRPPR